MGRYQREYCIVNTLQVFLGGIPWDITDNDLKAAFSQFGNVRLEWPTQHITHEHAGRNAKGSLSNLVNASKSIVG